MKRIVKKSYKTLYEEYYIARKKKSGISWFYNENMEMPATLKLLGNIKGKKILDLGCGPGLYSKVLKKKGAKVKGIDNSKNMIEIAKKETPGVEFIVGDAEKLPYKNGEFDIVVSPLVIGHLSSWEKLFNEVRRVLKKRGLFVFSIKNPLHESSVKIKWKGREFRIVKDYFKEGWRVGKWKSEKGKGVSIKSAHHHKTYSTIIKTILKHGFEIVDYEDARPLPKMAKLYPKHYKRTMDPPHFCVWKVKKDTS